MTIEKLRNFEPLFGAWYIDKKIAEGRSTDVYRVSRTANGVTDRLCLKTVRFPRTEKDFNRVLESGKYASREQYLSVLEAKLRGNMDKMMQLRAEKNIIRFDNYMIVKEINCFHVLILMELLTPLSDHLTSDKLNTKEMTKMGLDLCHALDGFRSAGIMHREIKPENIFVDVDGTYKLGDFGIDSVTETGDELEAMSNYLAPEVIRSSAAPDTCSDIYPLGILMYKFTNKNRLAFLPAFPSQISLADRQRAFDRRMSGERLPKPVDADSEFAKIIFKAAAYDPKERYQTPQELENDLRRYSMGQKIFTSNTGEPVQNAPVYKKATADDARFGSAPPKKSVVNERTRAQDEYKAAFDDDDDIENEKAKNKKIITLISVLCVILAVVLAFAIKAFVGTSDNETTLEATVEETSEEQTQATTEEETTEEQTTQEESTEAETTTQVPDTTEETTVPQTTTQIETTLAEEIKPGIFYTETDKKDGDVDENGKIYTEIKDPQAAKELEEYEIRKVLISLDDLGASPKQNGRAYICQATSENLVITKEEVEFTCLYDREQPENGIMVVIDIDKEIYYDDTMNFYIVFEQGALETDTAVNLPFQIKI